MITVLTSLTMRRLPRVLAPPALALGVALLPARGLAAPPPKPTDPRAQQLLAEGIADYEAGEYAAAVEKLERGHALDPALAFLYAWAQAERQQGHCVAAVELYREILDADHPSLTEYATGGMVECAKALAAAEAARLAAERPVGAAAAPSPAAERCPPPAPAPVPAPPRRAPARWHRDPWGATLVALGAAGVAAGTGLLAQGEVEAGGSSVDYEAFTARAERVQTLRVAGGVTLGLGIGLATAGIARWGSLAARDRKAGRVALTGAPGFAAIGWQGRF